MDWELWVKVAEGEMTEVEVGSALEEKIARFVAYPKTDGEL